MLTFKLHKTSPSKLSVIDNTDSNTVGKARRGTVTLNHGTIETPVFMPVGTYGTVKA